MSTEKTIDFGAVYFRYSAPAERDWENDYKKAAEDGKMCIRDREIALSAAEGIRDLENVVVFSISSDGTDGPTDAAGGIVNGKTAEELEALGIKCEEALRNNDSYHALEKIGGLIKTGATGTNVNDIAVILCKA